MGEAHTGASEDQQSPDPPCRGLVRLRRPVQFWLPDECLHREQQEGRGNKSHQRREQQRLADIGGLPPVDTRGAVLPTGQRVGDADPDDRADQRMRARCGETQNQVPRFQMIAAINSANTIAKPAELPTCNINSTGSSEMMPNATAPLDSRTPRKLKDPDQTTAT